MAPNSKLNAKRKAARAAAKPKEQRKPENPQQDDDVSASHIPTDLQQLLVNIFRHAFSERLETDIAPLLQEVKGHLYNRDFATAFGKENYLEAYAARWSPSRALGYAEVFWNLKDQLFLAISEGSPDSDASDDQSSMRVVCLGGGAGAEIVALAGVQKLLRSDDAAYQKKMVIDAVDIADWSPIVSKLQSEILRAPPLSKYASAAAKAANVALLDPESISIKFTQQDVLEKNTPKSQLNLENADLVTLLFTLNELYSMSLPATQQFLLGLTATMRPGSLLLVIDSPGSYSSVTLNGAEKKYPMQWLLDHTLLKQVNGNQKERGKDEVVKWEKVEEDVSRWFRLPEGLKYPIELENMRMQLHLYRRVDGSRET
ncbi:hypothetical protein ACN47E_008380 [Coniothyrium glycines]